MHKVTDIEKMETAARMLKPTGRKTTRTEVPPIEELTIEQTKDVHYCKPTKHGGVCKLDTLAIDL